MSIHWERHRDISQQEYFHLIPKDDKKKLENAYEQAAKIREFEINLYWKRAGYFWAFIVSIYTAFFSVQKEFYYDKLCGFTHGTLPLLVLSALGFFFCLAWLCSSYASKHWQENWEDHIDLLENEVTGPLYKIYRAGNSFSVSKVNIVAGWVVCICSAGLLVFEIVEFCKKLHMLNFLFFIVLLAFVVFGVSAFIVCIKGNTENLGKIEFDHKEYEGER